MSMGARIRKLRLEKGLSQVQLAKACKTSQQIISCYENDTVRQPRILARLAAYFQVSEGYLRYGEETGQGTRAADGGARRDFPDGGELTDQERLLVELFRSLTPSEQRYEIQRYVALREYRNKSVVC